MKDFCILMQCDDTYAPYVGVALVSLFEHNSESNKDIVIVNDNISSKNISKITELVQSYHNNVQFIEAETIVKEIKKYSLSTLRNSYTTYLKLFVIEQLSEKYRNVVYIDADTVIVGSITELFSLELRHNVCGMAVDLEPRIRGKQKIMHPEMWYNAGVIVFNTRIWKQEKCLLQIQDFIKNNNQSIYFHDQDILNFLFRDRIMRIDSKFNFMTIYQYIGFYNAKKVYGWSDTLYNEIKESAKDIRLYHCFSIMGKRPWNSNYPMEKEVKWKEYLILTPWKDLDEKKISLSFITKIQMVAKKILPLRLYIFLYKIMYLHQLQKYK